jgi:hypothetical protein
VPKTGKDGLKRKIIIGKKKNPEKKRDMDNCHAGLLEGQS